MVQVILSAAKCHYNTMMSILGLCTAYKQNDLTETSDNISTVWLTWPGWMLRGTDYTEDKSLLQSIEPLPQIWLSKKKNGHIHKDHIIFLVWEFEPSFHTWMLNYSIYNLLDALY